MLLTDAMAAIHTSFSAPPTSAADDFRRLLASSFAASLPPAQDMPVSDIAAALLSLYEQWSSEAK